MTGAGYPSVASNASRLWVAATPGRYGACALLIGYQARRHKSPANRHVGATLGPLQ